MKARTRFGSGATLLAGNLADMLFPLCRNIALSHLLPSDQYGLAISLSVVAAFAELATDIGIQYSAVRGDDRTDPTLLYGTLQSVALIRSVFLSICILAAAPIIVAALDQQQALWAFLLLALVPLVRGFQNLGIKELTRHYDYGPDVATAIATQLAWTAVTIALALVNRDYGSMLFGIIGGALVSVVVSHALSRRRWRLGWDAEAAREAGRFGRPLIPNGLANAFSIMGDRLLVGSVLGVVPLALYSNAMGIALIPRGQVIKFFTSIYLPRLVASKGDEPQRRFELDSWASWLSIAAFGYGIGLLAVGAPMIGLVFGATYLPSQALIAAIALDVAIKTLLAFPVPPCLAGGQTGFLLRGSIAGAAVVLLAALTLPLHRSLVGFIVALALGESLVLFWITWRTLALHPFSPRLAGFLIAYPIAAILGLIACAAFMTPLPLPGWIAFCTAYGCAGMLVYVLVLRASGLNVRHMLPLRASPVLA